MEVDEEAASWSLSPAELHAFHKREGELRALAKSLGVGVLFRYRRAESPRPLGIRCLQPWTYAFVRVNGDIAPCCAVFPSDRNMVMGNLLKDDFETIWRGDPFRSFRTTSVDGTNEFCQLCSYY